MTVKIDTDAEINSIRLKEQAGNPSTPAAGYWQLYAKSTGLFIEDDAGNIIGPMITGSSYPPFSGAVLLKSATQTIPSATGTAVTFDGELIDTDGYHNTGTNTSRLVAPATGYYMAGGSAEINAIDDGNFLITHISVNGTLSNGTGRSRTASSAANQLHSSHVAHPFQLNANDYIELFVTHNTGGNESVRETTNGTSFWIYRIA